MSSVMKVALNEVVRFIIHQSELIIMAYFNIYHYDVLSSDFSLSL